MSARCPYCEGKHETAADARFCYATYLIVSTFGGTLVEGSKADMALSDRIETVVRRERRQREAGLTPRGRRGARRPAPPPARPIMAPVPAQRDAAGPVPAQRVKGRAVTDGPSVDRYVRRPA